MHKKGSANINWITGDRDKKNPRRAVEEDEEVEGESQL